MINFLARIFVDDHENLNDARVRQNYGSLCGSLGLLLNIFLCCAKLLAGLMSSSVSIMTDAINNLSDAGSSIIMMLGFKLSGREPDIDHPFGHGRIEYVSGLIVSIIIIVLGVELGKTSIVKILAPTELFVSKPVFIILLVSVLVKLYMYYYNRQTGDRIKSQALKAASNDSFSDALATTGVLLTVVIYEFTSINVDGYCGLLVALFIIYTGVSSVKDTMDPLLGIKPDPEYVSAIEKYVMAQKGVLGMHDLVIHDYGPGRSMISLHAEVAANGNILEIHDSIDNAERKLKEVLGCDAVIHMDPIVTDDAISGRMRDFVKIIVNSVDEKLSIHDFRMVQGTTHTNLIFDILIPYGLEKTDEEIVATVTEKIKELPGNHYAVINVDKPMV